MKSMIRMAAAALCLASGGASAQSQQSYPVRPVRVVVPFPPGGGLDIVMRPVNERLSVALGQPFVMDIRTGAGGMTGTHSAAQAAPDGYTLLASSTGPLVITPALNRALKLPMPYDTQRDLAPITQLIVQPMCLVVHPSLPVKSVRELVAFAKARPGQLNYASAGVGNGTHLAAEMFKAQTGTQIVHVPYKGTALAQVDLISGQVHMMIVSIPALLPHLRSGRLRALAVGADARVPVLPDVPTMREQGLERFNANSWYGLFAPAGTPSEIVTRLNRETVRILRSNDIRASLAAQGSDTVGNSVAEFSAHIRNELAKWQQAVADAGIKPE
jgi:tripartite-type tricarboxylate transporter receptor subunit TctC